MIACDVVDPESIAESFEDVGGLEATLQLLKDEVGADAAKMKHVVLTVPMIGRLCRLLRPSNSRNCFPQHPDLFSRPKVGI